MELKYINPFIESVYDLFESMLSCKVERQNPRMAGALETHKELVAMIGLSGATRGNVALLLPEATALNLVRKFTGEAPAEADESVIDAIAELVNIIAGGAKARLSTDNNPINLSLPNVIKSRGCTVHYPSTSVWLDVPFTSDAGPFSLRLSFQFEADSQKQEDHKQEAAKS